MQELITTTTSIPTNGVRLHAETCGPPDGPLVLLLHGFPEYWAGFIRQMRPLAQAGFFAVAPDQRGCNLSQKPGAVADYHLDALAKDITGILDYFGREQAFIAGHDWGGVVAWHVAIHHPARVQKLAILNAPHPAAMARALTLPAWEQVAKSWYIYFFQIPGLPELLLSRRRYAALLRTMRRTARPGVFSKDDLARYVEAWSRPGALTAAINWYRAAVRGALALGREKFLQQADRRVNIPTLILWGERDSALIPQLAPWSLEWCDQGRLVRFPDASHWVQHEEARRVSTRLVNFFLEG